MPSNDEFKRLTDGQIIWIYGNMQLDIDIQIEGMCESCKTEVQNNNKCNRCGEKLFEVDNSQVMNKSFDLDKFNELAGED